MYSIKTKILTAVFVIVTLMTVQSMKKLQIPDKNTFKMDKIFFKMPKQIFCFRDPPKMSRALELKLGGPRSLGI